MRRINRLFITISAAALAGAMPMCALAEPQTAGDVTKSLQTIKSTADGIAKQRSMSEEQLRDAARKIGVEWQKVEPLVGKDFMVETKYANQSIASFERDWRDLSKAKADAKDVSSNLAELIGDENTIPPAPAPTSS